MAGRTDEQMLSRIGFAERWLARARRQWIDGNRTRSVLTLVLADAEVRHAMETAGTSGRAQARRPAAGAVLLLAVAVVAFLIVRWPVTPEPVATTPPPVEVRLASTSGELRDVMTRPALPLKTAASGRAVIRVTVSPAQSRRMTEPLEVSRHALSAHASGRPAVSVSPSSPSMPSLLDLVLTAERVLRRESALPSSP